MLKFISEKTIDFIENNFPSTKNPVGVGVEFAEDIIEQRPDWRIPDISLFFKFIKSNIGVIEDLKTYGNVMTPIRLLELTTYYEDVRCNAREEINKKNLLSEKEVVSSEKASEFVASILKRIREAHTVEYTDRKSFSMEDYEKLIIENKNNFNDNELAEMIKSLKQNSFVVYDENGSPCGIDYYYKKAIKELESCLKK